MEDKIQIRLGGALDQEFCDFWNADVAGTMKAEFSPGKKPQGGLAFALPPEVVLALKTIEGGALTYIGTEVAKLVWKKLRDFFQEKKKAQIPEAILIVVRSKRKVLNPLEMPLNVPEDFAELFKNGK
jgi:hypothetical protein